jgi:hypothetical protein
MKGSECLIHELVLVLKFLVPELDEHFQIGQLQWMQRIDPLIQEQVLALQSQLPKLDEHFHSGCCLQQMQRSDPLIWEQMLLSLQSGWILKPDENFHIGLLKLIQVLEPLVWKWVLELQSWWILKPDEHLHFGQLQLIQGLDPSIQEWVMTVQSLILNTDKLFHIGQKAENWMTNLLKVCHHLHPVVLEGSLIVAASVAAFHFVQSPHVAVLQVMRLLTALTTFPKRQE